MIRIFFTVLAGLTGLAFGSFLNVCLTRWPHAESVVMPRSHCRSCGRTLTWWENLPVLSWLALRGRCRTCGASIGWRYPAVELAVAILWAIMASRPWLHLFDHAPQPVIFYLVTTRVLMMLFLWLLLALAVLDAEHLWLPDFLTLPGIAVGLFAAGIEPFVLKWLSAATNLPFDQGIDTASLGPWTRTVERGFAAVAAASLILLIRWLYWLVRRQEGIGLGDAKLMAMIAAWLGLPGALLAFAIGVILGAVIGLAVLWRPKLLNAEDATGLTKLPLGAFLCIGGIVSTLWGQPIIAAYLRWSGLA